MPPKPVPKAGKAPEGKENKDTEKEKEKQELEIQLSMLIASTFANDELESKKRTLNQYIELATKLKDENARLHEEILERDRDSLQVVDFLRKEVEKKQEAIENLKNQIEEQRDHAADTLREREEELQETIAVKNDLVDDKEAEIKKLEDELESVARHKREKHEMEAQINNLQQDLINVKEKYERELSKLRFQSLEEKVRLKNEEKDLVDRFKQAVNQQAMELLDGQTKTIHTENIGLRLNHQKLEQEYTLLSKQSKVLEEEKKRKSREIQLGKQSIDEYSKQNYKSHKEIRDLTGRNRQLEKNATDIIKQYEDERRCVLEEKEAEALFLKDTIKDTQQALKVRSVELHRIQRLARVIIQQRSELEMFFTEALDYIREQIIKDRKAKIPRGSLQVSREQKRTQYSGGSQRRIPRSSESKREEYKGFVAGNFQPVTTTQETELDGELIGAEKGQLPPIQQSMTPSRETSARQSLASNGGHPVPPPPPHLGSNLSYENNQNLSSDRIDISELCWADKERVLRILFAKISTSKVCYQSIVGLCTRCN